MTRQPAEGNLTPDEERDLILRAQKGEREAFGELVFAHRERAMAAALSLLRNHEDARDLTQDAFVRAFRALKRFEPARPFFPWYYRILRNLCLTHLERHGPSRKVSLDQLVEERHMQFESPHEDVRDRIQREQMVRHLKGSLDHLKPEFREIIAMKHFEDMTYEEIAMALRIPIGTVMSRLYHARKALAKLMEKHR